MRAGGAPAPRAGALPAGAALWARVVAAPAAWLLAAGAALVAVQLVLSSRVAGPVIVADEFGYLGAARFLAGADAVPLLGPSPFYWPGYALLLVPLEALLSDPAGVYRGAQVLNAALAAAHLVPLYALARAALGLDRPRAALVAVATAAYPAFLLQSGFAWTESLVPLLFTSWALAVLAAAGRPTPARAAGLAAVTGLMYMTHPRMVGVALVTAAALALLWRGGRLSRPAAAGAAAILALLVVATHLLNRALADRIYAPGYPGASSRDALAELLEPAGWGNLALAAAGQAWYLTVATLGLAPLGAVWLGRRAWRGRRGLWRGGAEDPTAAAAAAALAGAAAIFAISSVWMAANFVKPDKLVYGRYNEAFLGVLLAAGLAALLAPTPRRRLAGLAAAAAGIAALGAVIRLGHGSEALGQDFSPVTVLGILVHVRGDGLPVLTIVASAALGTLVLAALAHRAPRAAVATAAAFFVLAAVDVSARHVDPFASERNARFELRGLGDRLSGLGPISYDRSGSTAQAADDRALFAYQFWFDANPMRFYVSRRGEQPPTDLVMTDRPWPAGVARGARLVAGGPGADPALWVMPGPTADALARRGLLPPAPSRPAGEGG